MANFERGKSYSKDGPKRGSRDGKRSFGGARGFSKDGPKRSFGPKRFSRDGPRDDFGDRSADGKFPRNSKRNASGRRDFKLTKVTCAACGDKCEVPFVPNSDKPIYCSACFNKSDKRERPMKAPRDNHELDQINEKLNKIMVALGID